MSSQIASTASAGRTGDSTIAKLHGRRLLIARIAWVAVAAFTVGIFVAGVPSEFARLNTVCTDAASCAWIPRLTADKVEELGRLGLSVNFFAAYFVAVEVAFAVVSSAVGAVIFWRKSDESMAMFASLALLALGVSLTGSPYALSELHPAWKLPAESASFLGSALLILFLYLFPDGRFVPRWTRWTATAAIVLVAPTVFFTYSALDLLRYPLLMTLSAAVVAGTILFSQTYRYRRVSRPPQRQQTKWVLFGIAAALGGLLGIMVLALVLPEVGLLASMAGNTAIFFFMLLIPLSIGAAILRYRLFNIDVIINRTLVYGTLTAVVVGVYVLVVGGLGALAQARGDLAVSLIAVGVVAILVQPLRKRLQRFADRMVPTTRPVAQEPPGSLERERPALVRMSRRTAGRLAWAIWALSVPLAALSGLLGFLGASARNQPDSALPVLFALLLLTYPTVGALIASRRPENPIGWIFCAVGLVLGAGILASSYAEYALHASSHPLPGVQYAAWFSKWASFPLGFLAATMLFLLFPDGRLPSPLALWRPVAWTAVVGSVMGVLGAAFSPNTDYPAIGNPVAIEGALGNFLIMLGNFGWTFLAVSCFAAMISPVLRLRRASGVERQQLKWFVYATALMAAGFGLASGWPSVAAGSLPYMLGEVAWNLGVLGFMVLPVATAVAILRYRLYDIDRIINRTLVYGVLTALVVGAYALVVGALSTLLQTSAGQGLLIPVLATGLIAVLFTPVRDRLQRSVNRLMYGDRDDPYMVLSRLGKRLEATLSPAAALSTVAETVAGALKLPYAAIELERDGGFEKAAEHGTPAGEPLVLPLHYGSEPVGRLVLAPRAPGEPFAESDLCLLHDLARQVGIAAHAARLTDDLQRSRERLVSTREEERRRLRRDLHDGLGPQLATFTLKLDAARNLLASEPEAASSLLLELKTQTQDTISGIRRLAYELRPPALDELGLTSALREQATAYGPAFSVEAHEELPPLPAAVEVAAYRIAVEAMTNTARHARARVCRVRIAPSDKELEVEIIDDGIGLPDGCRAGVGLSSMRERAAEIGGTCEIESMPGGGTRVLARLPLPLSEG